MSDIVIGKHAADSWRTDAPGRFTFPAVGEVPRHRADHVDRFRCPHGRNTASRRENPCPPGLPGCDVGLVRDA